ncbi:hypothetical protein [Erythrobacter sp.]|uniref:hypothetical protein n=1 Tax=Erythrobacter sp. TaxID=1042 RepID=UPI0032671897
MRGGLRKTTSRICNRKKRFASRGAAEAVAADAHVTLRAYKCELCRQFHLTSKTKGMKLPEFELIKRREAKLAKKADPKVLERKAP